MMDGSTSWVASSSFSSPIVSLFLVVDIEPGVLIPHEHQLQVIRAVHMHHLSDEGAIRAIPDPIVKRYARERLEYGLPVGLLHPFVGRHVDPLHYLVEVDRAFT